MMTEVLGASLELAHVPVIARGHRRENANIMHGRYAASARTIRPDPEWLASLAHSE